MFEQCFNLIKSAVDRTLPLIWSIFDTIGAWKYVIAVIFATLVIRNLLYPMLKEGVVNGMGSDSSRYGDAPIDAEFTEVNGWGTTWQPKNGRWYRK